MTYQAIKDEIRKRIEYLDNESQKAYEKMVYFRVCGDVKNEDKMIDKRRKISCEIDLLKDMLR